MKNCKNEARKCAYAPPVADAMHLHVEGVICQSNPNSNPGDSEFPVVMIPDGPANLF